jgi:transposase
MPRKTNTGAARFQRAQRNQIEWQPLALDDLVEQDHPVRLVWTYTGSLDLSELYARIKAVEGQPGRDPIDPRILLALWLYATIDGIGTARKLDRLCREHVAYRWLCGGVPVNYHTLSDFRSNHAELLDQLLTQSVAVLLHQGLVELNHISQDGMKVRASAGSHSFRRKATLEQCLKRAQAQVEALKRESEDDPTAEERRIRAARERAAREREQRLQEALAEREQLAAKQEDREKGAGESARCSSTDPEARIMKMGDGGFRPAYNVQLATADGSRVITGVDVTNAGTDGGQMQPMTEQHLRRYGTQPQTWKADGSFVNLADITDLGQSGISVYLPLMELKRQLAAGRDPYASKPGDSPEVRAWRARMSTPEAQAIYAQRASTAEFSNAGFRNRGLYQFVVRGLKKVKAVALLQALAHNFQRTLALRRAAGLPLA